MNELTTLEYGPTMSPALQIMLDDKLFERVKLVAKYMAAAEGFTPKHLINKTEACFAVVTRSLTWKLDPFAVAQSTYSPAPGKVGFEGKLCQAIIENSGKVEGGVKYEPFGDWTKVHGKFEIITNAEGKKYPKATYTDKDEIGLGVIAKAQVRGEKEKREFKIDLRQAFPRNSTLWATDPFTQLCYRAARGLGNIAMPGIFMGVPFEGETFDTHNMKDVTPKENTILDNLNDAIKADATKVTDIKEPAPEKAATVKADPEAASGDAADIADALADWLGDIAEIPTLDGLKFKFDKAVEDFKNAPPDIHKKLVQARDKREAELKAPITPEAKGKTMFSKDKSTA